MKLTFSLIETDAQITKDILNALLPDVQKMMSDAVKYLREQLPPLVQNAIIIQPEYQSLSNGSLRYELGVPDINERIMKIFSIWLANMQIKYEAPKISGSQIKSKLNISMIKTDFSDILSSDVAEIVDANTGSIVSWLRWLLLDGTVTLVEDHTIIIGKNARSRTGQAIMRQSDGKSWHVPNEFAGTESNNWITRAIDSIADEIDKVLERALS